MTNPVEMTDRQAMASLFRKKAAVMSALSGGMAKTGSTADLKVSGIKKRFEGSDPLKRTQEVPIRRQIQQT